MLLCYVVILIGAIMCLVAAFRQSVLWGLVYLFVPFASLVFLIKYWNEAKNGFFTSLFGLAVLIGLAATQPNIRNPFMNLPVLSGFHENKAKELSTKIEKRRDDLARFQEQFTRATEKANQDYKALTERRKALNTGDQKAVHQFNLDVAAYQQQDVLHLSQLTQEIDATTKDVDDLLSQRSASKQVVIYSTSWCPACQAAKRYMDGKGISYRDVDVEKSPEGAAEYRSKGGNGSVPFIVVGDRTMTGFSASQLDSML